MFYRKSIKSLFLNCNDTSSVAKIHALLIISGYINNGSYNTQLIATYARTGSIEHAHKVFDKIPDRRIDVWNAMIIAYSRKHCPGEVINLYNELNSERIRPDSSTFTMALKACTSLMNLEMGEEIRRHAIDSGYENDVFVASSLLNLYAKCGKMNEAMKVFDKMPKRDVVSWTTMITGFAQSGRGSEAIDVFRLMQNEYIEGDRIAILGLIQACSCDNVRNTKLGLSVHAYLIRRHLLAMDIVVQTSLIDMHAKTGNIELAYRVFESIQCKNAVACSALISGYAQNGLAGNAFDLLVEMQIFGFKPDLASVVGALLACSQTGSLKLARSLHGYAIKNLVFDQILGTALINTYSKCGSLSYARNLFDKMPQKDLVMWNAMIACYGIHGYGNEALTVFHNMLEANTKPDHTTFASLMSALSHAGLVHEGRLWFKRMVDVYNIEPVDKHYACMADLLARGGHVEEAYDLIRSMKTEPGLAFWVALLSGCYNHGKFLIGEMVVKKILELKPDVDTGIYALISNFYAKLRRWDEVANVRNVMKKSGMKKMAGNSVVEVNGKVHAFVMEDKSHFEYREILKILKMLDLEMTSSED
ncbi:putative tetratricopeptide-like helical domain superfamily [Helianthus annuus]|uniref:Putative tetratricopeptide repeat (TPR)-like superfamily protein n=1 Tax=Helianthus annuus TaxID=4232 RepID=A0A251TG68_HELAN|nr:putative pentatricopeptide repeat-containing protein At3g25060, mitochondrial [Helianthus annuus]KAF5784752.1 putative tetratricopeptide-like helical domain superfamily [Helianthus annuus]KAJ0519893.1 putative tetratricopeptide-like helical domain superfamily [Helianthus annuus]KAJ0528529.1 putative tetratricopeptide-like helical domain superfamily [Helianthus annuus]KAJ0695451.1 putative tetratricopeptide-like helical domain superfamily [Helianthus annuus]KAJ0882158.1 putative tetratricope